MLSHDLGGDTFTTVALDRATGRLGVAMATRSVAVGNRCPVVKPGFAAGSVQSIADPRQTLLCGRLIELGLSAQKIVADMAQSDHEKGLRQVGVVDIYGNAAVHTGDENKDYAGHVIGDGFLSMANAVVSEKVVVEMARAYQNAMDQPLEERLMRSIEAGGKAGGQPDGQRSSSILVFGRESFAELDLRVDMHDEPIGELRRLVDHFKPLIPYFLQRPYNPRITRDDHWLQQRQS